jgi:predicted nucleic acid-binding protein
MRTYWDSSAIFSALEDASLRSALMKGSAVTRLHAFAEVFSAITGGRRGYRVDATTAARMLAEVESDMDLIELMPGQVLEALQHAETRGVRGGRVHDYLHAVAAKAAGAHRILTLDRNDFSGLVDGLEVVQLAHPPAE